MLDFDPIRIASEWHAGQGSALYAYSSTGRIPSEDMKDRLMWEIEDAMEHADDQQLDELEYLLMHVEEQPVSKGRMEETQEAHFVVCNECGQNMVEGGKCECSMQEADWLDSVVSKVKNVAMADVGGPKGMLSPVDRVAKHGEVKKAKSGDDFKKWQEKYRRTNESVLRAAIAQIIKEMKLGISGGGNFNFGSAEEFSTEEIMQFLSVKKKGDEAEKERTAKRNKNKSKR